MSDRNKAHSLTKREFAELFGRSEKQLERYFQAGMPHKKKGRDISIPMPEGRVWFLKHIVEQAKEEAKPTTRSASIDRQVAAQADLAELELAEKRDELMRVEDFERLLADAFSRVRARLTNLPPRIAGVVLGASSIQDAMARIEPLVREAMEELRSADDVPTMDDAEESAA